MPSNVRMLPVVARTPPSSGDRLRSVRLRAGLSQERAGQLLHLDARQVRRWENGESPVDALDLYLALEELAAGVRGRAA